MTPFSVAALSSAPKNAGGDTGATIEVVTVFCNNQYDIEDLLRSQISEMNLLSGFKD